MGPYTVPSVPRGEVGPADLCFLCVKSQEKNQIMSIPGPLSCGERSAKGQGSKRCTKEEVGERLDPQGKLHTDCISYPWLL